MAGMSSGMPQYRSGPIEAVALLTSPRRGKSAEPIIARPALLDRSKTGLMSTRTVLSVVVLGVLFGVPAALGTGVLWAQQAPAPAPAPQSGDGPPVVFRVEVDYVEADLYVTDAQGNPVADLRA